MPLKLYDEVTELESIRKRYENTPKAISHTLERLHQSTDFLQIVERLRGEGWKDWHLLLAIFNAVMNWHIEGIGANQDPLRVRKEGASIYRRLLEQGETENDSPIPLERLSIDEMQRWLEVSITYYLEQKGATFRSGLGYDFKKIRTIVSKRYCFFELDVPHQSIFSAK